MLAVAPHVLCVPKNIKGEEFSNQPDTMDWYSMKDGEDSNPDLFNKYGKEKDLTLVQKLAIFTQSKQKNIKSLSQTIQILVFIALLTNIISVGKNISSLIVISSTFQLFAVLGLFNKNQYVHSMTIKLFIISIAMRCTVVTMTGGYKPKDRTGHWLFQTLDISGLLILTVAHYVQNRGGWREWIYGLIIFLVSYGIGSIWHINLVKKPMYDAMWAGSIFVECAAMVPQIYSIYSQHRTENNLDCRYLCPEMMAQNGQFVSMIFCSRVTTTIFWGVVYFTMATERDLTMALLLSCQIFQLILASDITYCWFCKKIKDSFRPKTSNWV
jgi:hypothetical protein